ncbi:MAG: RNA polymerase sigma factor [Candidatus Saccharicenans sp.]
MRSRRKREKEFEKLLNNYSSFLHSLVRRYNLDRFGLEAEDLLQEVRLRIWKLVSDEKKLINPASYLRKMVDSVVIDQIRRLRKEEEFFLSEKLRLISELDPDPPLYDYSTSSLREEILRALDQLMDTRKMVVKLYLLNMSLKEIASYLNFSEDKTRNLLYRGLTDLKNLLREQMEKNEQKDK